MLRKSASCMESAVKTTSGAGVLTFHIKSHYLLCNKKSESLYSRLEKKKKNNLI